ncbi:glycerophosphodiester phosphodiesterase [Luteolibacter flavescens]|uniref:Glycerophosphodiester phosphodiesterase n=1 Tax=Luteolibacter flavescens TaxID=1859460 RepID=A0ABT3FX49_9BACT|nr:glycerophosphodiester phosphodiesterase [Luteolibacter flavescens]MCW1887575.1 glycerophosphodiester phosphodiesterase [Luteolibacter flavescens]
MKHILTLAAGLMAATAMHAAEPFLVAHRGASHDAPENTLPAFELAWKQGADAIEGDFYLTKDGKIVCIHDGDTKRTGGGTKLVVKDSTLAELQALDAGAWFKPEFKGTKMPTLSEVAATVPAGKKIYVEVKCGPEIVPAMMEDLAASGLKDEQIVIISFQAPVIAEVKKVKPAYKACWLASFGKDLPLNPGTDKVLATLRDIKADGFSSKADARLDAAFVKTIQDAGFEYHCWTVDDVPTARRFLGFGTLSVTTNRPEFIRLGLRAGD